MGYFLINSIETVNTPINVKGNFYLDASNPNFFERLNISSNYILNANVIKESSWPVFAIDQYISPKVKNGSVVCANCHTNDIDIEVSMPQAIWLTRNKSLIDSSLRIKIDALAKQVATTGKSADLNMSSIGMFPYEFTIEGYSNNNTTNSEKKVSPYMELGIINVQNITDNENIIPIKEQSDTSAFVFNIQHTLNSIDIKNNRKHYSYLGV